MDKTYISDLIEVISATIVAFGGYKLITYFINLNNNKRISAAEAYKAEYQVIMEDYKRMKNQVDELNAKVDRLYLDLHKLEKENINLIKEKGELLVALKEAEKHICLQPDDKCIMRLNDNVKCRLVGLLRGEYTKDHPNIIMSEQDMLRGNENSGISEKPNQGEQP